MTSVFSKKDFIATKWFTLEKMVQLITGVFIVPQIFNVLGTIDLGKLKLVESVLGMLTPLFFLGLSSICIREIVYKPKNSSQILATAFYLRLISWFALFIGILIYFSIAQENVLTSLYLIITCSYFFKLTDIFEYYLLAKKSTKYIFISKIISLIIIVSLQYYGVKKQFDVYYFAKLIILDFIIQGCIYGIILKFKKPLLFKQWKFSWPLGKSLLKMSFPFILSNSLIMFYISVDELFLKYFYDDYANGLFATVQFLVLGLSWNIGFSIINALYPSLAESFQQSRTLYIKKIKKLLKIMLVLGFIIASFYTFFGNHILDTFFTASFAQAKTALLIFCWAPLFVFIGMIYEKHLINTEDLQKNVYRFILGCVVNVILCYLLIPVYYVNGAAIAVLSSHFITNIAYILIDKKSRKQVVSIF
ncbi:oligosaccharide flippase family protein [Lacinutrix sp. C3R15]|uniref:oligosaccharide flippase family protein n=1 Tax=Flavobacteriaceae TaxID=49546 RepID=UPI001C08D08F|nr:MULTISPECIES: oligosaccharide flippase family protein [Flavobacteriaceae]MBU2940363.1 oligosaccharide flippase family protein [Lacinutrix sp. C3R15]MDO6623683.1 oligosaccharide flippase family protein [Oceanihabitans sp. 1_MG-2023]